MSSVMPQEGLHRIFGMFQRMHGSEYEGTGIGLALVRKAVERMGSKVGVESEPGKGSRFWVEFKGARDQRQGLLFGVKELQITWLNGKQAYLQSCCFSNLRLLAVTSPKLIDSRETVQTTSC